VLLLLGLLLGLLVLLLPVLQLVVKSAVGWSYASNMHVSRLLTICRLSWYWRECCLSRRCLAAVL
jgi:hypothetical protein